MLLPSAATGAPPPPAAAATTTVPAVAAAAEPADAPEVDFYLYRAQSGGQYPLENVNAADLGGVLWYLHHEVVAATPRKYHIDRIRRYRVRSRPTREYWNVHHRHFGPFYAFDGGRCTTPGSEAFYHQYGFVVGCQFVPLQEGAYRAPQQTTGQCDPGSDQCHSPLWFAMPGPCPEMGMQQQDLRGNSVTLDVTIGKPPECMQRMPGGRCSAPGSPTGTPDCTYSVEDAGEILLSELAGIPDYNDFWNVSYYRCLADLRLGLRTEPCIHNTEYDGKVDAGIGNHFWDGRYDVQKCGARMQAAEALFLKHYPDQPVLDPVVCDFDTIYQDELTWPANHTGGLPSPWWAQRMLQ